MYFVIVIFARKYVQSSDDSHLQRWRNFAFHCMWFDPLYPLARASSTS